MGETPPLVQEFLDSRASESPRSLSTYRNALLTYVRLTGGTAIDRKRYDRAIGEMVRMGRNPNGIATYAVIYRMYAQYCGVDTREWQTPRTHEVPRMVLKGNEIVRLLEACRKERRSKDEKEFVVRCLLSTGLRISELVNLKWSDVEIANDVLTVKCGKGSKNRRVRLYTSGKEAFIQWAAHTHPDLTLEEIGLLDERVLRVHTADAVRFWLRSLGEKCGLSARHLHPHLLRHSSAILDLENGANLRVVQMRLGHASLQTTARYLQLTDDAQKKAPDRTLPP
jgi:integrase/recombinase XerD